jgi:hypothetical protein
MNADHLARSSALGYCGHLDRVLRADCRLTAPDLLPLANTPASGEPARHDHALLHHGQYSVRVDDRLPRRRVWESYRTATQTVLQEREGIVAVLELANAVPSESTRLRDRVDRYVTSVVDDEWYQRPVGHGSDHTDAALLALLGAAASQQTGIAASAAVQAELLNAVQRISAARSARLVLMHAPNDSPRWTAVLLLALLTQISVAVAHLDRVRAQVVALSLSTAAAIIALALVAMLERPFDGANQVSPEPLRRAIAAE